MKSTFLNKRKHVMTFSKSKFSKRLYKTAKYANKNATKTTTVTITFTTRTTLAFCTPHAAHIELLLLQAPLLRKVKIMLLPSVAVFYIVMLLL